MIEGEIKANSGQLKAKDIAAKLEEMNQRWEFLVTVMREQSSKLGQKETQNDYNRVTAGLLTAAKEKGAVLASLLKAREYFFEEVEVESWIWDKNR